MDEVKSRLVALLPPVLESKVTGEATVLQLFDIHLKAKTIKKVAGCRVVNGIIEKSRNARVIRDGVTIHDGEPPGPLHALNSPCERPRDTGHDALSEERCDRGSQRLRMWC